MSHVDRWRSYYEVMLVRFREECFWCQYFVS